MMDFVVFDSILNANRDFMYYFLQSVEPKWKLMGQTGSQMNLNTTLINETLIALPSEPEQKAIAKIFSDLDENLIITKSKHEKYTQIKQGMMEQLLSGKVRLVDGDHS
jgi:type I restriction enzyme S subunit